MRDLYSRRAFWLAAPLGAVGAISLWRGFAANQPWTFYGGLAALAVALAAFAFAAQRARIRLLPELGLALVASLSVFAFLEAAWALRDALFPGPGVFGADFYTYDRARADRAGFERWWRLHLRRWARLDPRLVMTDPTGRNPYVLVPGAIVPKGEATVRINGLGFRGPEIARAKGPRFRIVVLGESTTFGITEASSDRPWPEVLQEKIAREFACDSPIEVINAGVPGWTLANQLNRLDGDVFPLEPDLLISYHGYNGFPFFLHEIDGLAFSSRSALRFRPSRILEVAERYLYNRSLLAAQPPLSLDADDQVLLRTGYAELYRRLAEVGRQHGALVALATFDMAVNPKSPEEVIHFFEGAYPDARSRIVANRLHSRIVELVAHRSGALAIDTSHDLDGAYQDLYVDLVHFTQAGRDQLAENVLEGLTPTLTEHPALHCRRIGG